MVSTASHLFFFIFSFQVSLVDGFRGGLPFPSSRTLTSVHVPYSTPTDSAFFVWASSLFNPSSSIYASAQLPSALPAGKNSCGFGIILPSITVGRFLFLIVPLLVSTLLASGHYLCSQSD